MDFSSWSLPSDASVLALQIYFHLALVRGVVDTLCTVKPTLLRQANVTSHPRIITYLGYQIIIHRIRTCGQEYIYQEIWVNTSTTCYILTHIIYQILVYHRQVISDKGEYPKELKSVSLYSPSLPWLQRVNSSRIIWPFPRTLLIPETPLFLTSINDKKGALFRNAFSCNKAERYAMNCCCLSELVESNVDKVDPK